MMEHWGNMGYWLFSASSRNKTDNSIKINNFNQLENIHDVIYQQDDF